jgi:manganese/zinc/iron transport system permease protein
MRSWLLLLLLLTFATSAEAARIGEGVESDVWGQAVRFFSFQDASLRLALLGALLLGLNCGLLGGFVVVRRMALVGDMLSHAVLPGIVLGFLWNQTKDPLAILIGALLAGAVATAVNTVLNRTTRLKPDAIQGLVLASFYGIGICLLGLVQQLPTAAKSGLDQFLFGQAAALSAGDVTMMAVATGLSLLLVIWFFHDLLALSFHRGFGESVGLRMALLHQVIMLLTAFAIIVAMQAVGVVLVSAMLIIPAATAYLLTDRLHRLLGLSAVLGMAAAGLGAFTSFLGNHLPTGPLMVLAGAGFFATAFLFGPRHGWLTRVVRLWLRRARMERENTLKAMHRVLEDRGGGDGVSLTELAALRREDALTSRAKARELVNAELATLSEDGQTLFFTPAGEQRARAVVRNHRLWELYLTHAASFSPDHVHDQAEEIEHVLGEETVRQLSRRLDFPKTDPHGRPIPSVDEIHGKGQPGTVERGGLGYQP